MSNNENNFMQLYLLTKGLPPYQPRSTWGVDRVFKPDSVLQHKLEFKVNELLHPKKTK